MENNQANNSSDEEGSGQDEQFQRVQTRSQRRKGKKNEQKGDEVQQPPITRERNGRPPRPRGTILFFPKTCDLNNEERSLWINECRKEGYNLTCIYGKQNHNPIPVAHDQQTIEKLTAEEHNGVILYIPSPKVHATKVIIKGIHPSIPLSIIEEACPNMKGLVRNKFSTTHREVIGWWNGTVPKYLILEFANTRYPIEEYINKPRVCNNCSLHGHTSDNCTKNARCRYCAGEHHSSECLTKIQNGIHVAPKCVTCGRGHNANSAECQEHNGILNRSTLNTEAPSTPENTIPPAINAWQVGNIGRSEDKIVEQRTNSPPPIAQRDSDTTNAILLALAENKDNSTELRREITELRREITELKKEVTELKIETEELKKNSEEMSRKDTEPVEELPRKNTDTEGIDMEELKRTTYNLVDCNPFKNINIKNSKKYIQNCTPNNAQYLIRMANMLNELQTWQELFREDLSSSNDPHNG